MGICHNRYTVKYWTESLYLVYGYSMEKKYGCYINTEG